MKLFIDISNYQFERIQQQLNQGSFISLAQFISAAIENQLFLENEDLTNLKNLETSVSTSIELHSQGQSNEFEKLKLKNLPAKISIITSPTFENLVFKAQKIPEDKTWIWGQINKIFPVKLGLRILHESLHGEETLSLNQFLENVSNKASICAEILRNYEEKHNKNRSEKISAGLPSHDDSSKSRYKFQFIAYQRKDGLLDGAMALMRFCNIIKKNNKLMIGMTEEGLSFSLLKNPIIDESNFDISLSHEESLFYVNHAKEKIKGEYNAMKWMMSAIKRGCVDRESLNLELINNYSNIWGDVSSAVINTQRAGLTARMFELGLLEKEKNGIHVIYRPGRNADKYLSS
jgi:hypothetical protein